MDIAETRKSKAIPCLQIVSASSRIRWDMSRIYDATILNTNQGICVRLQAYASTAPAVAPANLACVRLNEDTQRAHNVQRMHRFLFLRGGHFESRVTVGEQDWQMELQNILVRRSSDLDLVARYTRRPTAFVYVTHTTTNFIASSYGPPLSWGT